MHKNIIIALFLAPLLASCIGPVLLDSSTSEDCEGCGFSSSPIAPTGTFLLSIDKEAKSYIVKDVSGYYAPSTEITLQCHVIYDADLICYLNGVSLGYGSSNDWIFKFNMPMENATITISVTSVTAVSFETAYPWAVDLKASDISEIQYKGHNYDVGPGGMDTFRHGTSDEDKNAYVSFIHDNILEDNPIKAQICGGYPQTYTVVTATGSYSFTYIQGFLDERYVTKKSIVPPSIFDYYSFIAYGKVDLIKNGMGAVRTVDTDTFLADIHFKECAYESAPSFTGYALDMGIGIEFIDATHFQYGKQYYEVISAANFASYING
jgi:hypothetical protein